MKRFRQITKVPSQSKQHRYTLFTSLKGHRGAVACLSAHPLGTYVATGGKFCSWLYLLIACSPSKKGDFGTNIWYLPTSQLIRAPAGPGDRGATTALAWITRTNDSEDGLAFGTENGYLCVWRRSQNQEVSFAEVQSSLLTLIFQWVEVYCQRLTGGEDSQEIVAMSYDIGSAQIAVVHRSQVVHRFLMNGVMHPNPLSSKNIPKHWPQAVGFGQTSARGPEIWSFGREDGVM